MISGQYKYRRNPSACKKTIYACHISWKMILTWWLIFYLTCWMTYAERLTVCPCNTVESVCEDMEWFFWKDTKIDISVAKWGDKMEKCVNSKDDIIFPSNHPAVWDPGKHFATSFFSAVPWGWRDNVHQYLTPVPYIHATLSYVVPL